MRDEPAALGWPSDQTPEMREESLGALGREHLLQTLLLHSPERNRLAEQRLPGRRQYGVPRTRIVLGDLHANQLSSLERLQGCGNRRAIHLERLGDLLDP